MRSVIYRAEVKHNRCEPIGHAFRHSIYVFAFDCDELAKFAGFFPILGVNRKAVLSLFERDYLPGFEGSLRQKVEAFTNPESSFTRIVLITVPRYFGYVFNPVSFYVCYDESGAISKLVAEVSNTFGERFAYCLSQPQPLRTDQAGPFEFDKQFYVSPFFEVSGRYRVWLREFGQRLDIGVDLLHDQRVVFNARLQGEALEIGWGRLVYLLLAYPFSAWLTMSRISWQALKLFFVRRLKVASKPDLPQGCAAYSNPGLIHKWRLAIVNWARLWRS